MSDTVLPALAFLRDGIEEAGDAPGKAAAAFFEGLTGGEGDSGLSSFFEAGIRRIREELDALDDPRRLEALKRLPEAGDEQERTRLFRAAFFPEAEFLDPDPDTQIGKLRERRLVAISKPAKSPIADPPKELIFTSNVLLGPPMPGMDVPDDPKLAAIFEGAGKAAARDQDYWYDHPVPVGIPPENDEVIYGLRGLAETLAYEKNLGNAEPEDRLTVLLSVSVTHRGLHEWALPWLKAQLESAGEDFGGNLDVHAFTEDDSREVVKILAPWLEECGASLPDVEASFGVDGEYGRHYSFLKAMPALASVFDGGNRKGTFKIDLDQVFPQDELVAETGKSALEHFKSPLWGAEGLDWKGVRLELGMIAGALVNEKDIGAGLFTPDIPWPSGVPGGEDYVFFKQQPMAVSTRAELMTRYGFPGFPDGEQQALQRIHVTGGTNGILFDALRRHRPFTPSFVGRAEDQAYILSVLNRGRGEQGANLAYAHASGLIMRHDKEAFATDAVKAGKAGSYVGDLVRLLVFSGYAGLLEGGSLAIKEAVDPFTGCFITPLPMTLAFLRLALRLLSLDGGSENERGALLDLAERRLTPWLADAEGQLENMMHVYQREELAWNWYYDAIGRLESELAAGSDRALNARNDFNRLLERCRIAG